MRSVWPILILAACLTGCGFAGSAPSPTATRVAQAVSSPATSLTRTTSASPGATVTPTFVVGKRYLDFVKSLCQAFQKKDSNTVIADLPYFQYNSGLRWGMMGDGEGNTSDPSTVRSWLAASNVHCEYYTPGENGHGTLLASGWSQPGPSTLVEVDIYPSGKWKINDFTFGATKTLYAAMQAAGPSIAFHG